MGCITNNSYNVSNNKPIIIFDDTFSKCHFTPSRSAAFPCSCLNVQNVRRDLRPSQQSLTIHITAPRAYEFSRTCEIIIAYHDFLVQI